MCDNKTLYVVFVQIPHIFSSIFDVVELMFAIQIRKFSREKCSLRNMLLYTSVFSFQVANILQKNIIGLWDDVTT